MNFDDISTESKAELELTSAPVLSTNIKPPPAIFTDLWGESDDSSSDPDEALLTDMPTLNRTGGGNQEMPVSEKKGVIVPPSASIDIPDELWESELLSEAIEANEDWTEYAVTSFGEPDIFEDLDLFDIDAVLAEQEEALQLRKQKRGRGTSTWRQRLERWGGGVHVNWDNPETARWRVLEQLGYTSVPLSREIRDYIVQAARNAKLSRRQKVQLTTQLANARAQLALLPPLNEKGVQDPFASKRQALQAEITKIEQILASKMQWMTIKRAVQFLGQDLEFDEIITRDNSLIQW